MTNTFNIIKAISAIVLVIPAIASAAKDSWFDKITAVESVDSDRPASISFTSLENGEDFYAVSLGVLYHVSETDRWSVAPTVEYQKNTALNQDVLSGGLKGSYLIGDILTDDNTPSFAVLTDEELKYKWDDVKDDESWMPTVTFTPLYSPLGLGSSIGNDLLRVQFNLSGGVEYEEVANGGDGDTLRATVDSGIVLYPQGALKDIIVFGMSNKYWNELSASGKFDDKEDNFNLLKIDATYYLFRNKKNDSFGVQLAYKNGASPNLEDQSLVTFGFVFTL